MRRSRMERTFWQKPGRSTWDEQLGAGSSPAGGVKFVSIVKRKADVLHAEVRRVLDEGARSGRVDTSGAAVLFGERETPARPGTGPVDGYAALQFPSVEAARAAGGSDVGELLSEIQSNFAEEITATQVREVGVL